MTDSPSTPPAKPEDRGSSWAAPVRRLDAKDMPGGGVNLNVSGRQVTTPLQGFGQMWQKTYQVRLEGVTVDPHEVVRVWRKDFSSFWPKNNYFYAAKSGPIEAGDVAVLNLAGPGGMTAPGGAPMISTGIYVIYADEDQFTFLTPEGHMFAGMNTFSAHEEDGVTIVQIQALVRASDPLYEISLKLGLGHKMEDDFWNETLRNLAARFGVSPSQPTLTKVCVDPKRQWSEAKNIWQNAAVRTTVHTLSAPLRWVGRRLGGKNKQ